MRFLAALFACVVMAISGVPCFGHGDTIAYYRFEDGSGTAIFDSEDLMIDGSHSGSYSSSVPLGTIPLTNEANSFSLSLVSPQEGAVTGQPFIFHADYGNATLEFFIKAPNQAHHSVFWTRGDDTDANRFNIHINPGGVLGVDYRDPAGVLHDLTPSTPLVATPDSWTHVAISREVQGNGGHLYRYYINGALIDTKTDVSPNLPNAASWQISGRTGFQMTGLLDEIRFSTAVLEPNEFLISTGTALVANPLSSRIGATAVLKATLTRIDTSAPLVGRSIQFNINGSLVGSANTNASGVASLEYVLPESLPLGSAGIEAIFAGETGFSPAEGSSSLSVAKGNPKLKVSNASGLPGATVTLKARLRNESKQPIVGRTIQFKVQNTVVGSTVTGVDGWANLSYQISPAFKHNTTKTITAIFAGDAQFNGKSKTATLTVQ